MNLILMKPIFLQVGKEGILPELVQNPVYGLNVRLARILGVAPKVINNISSFSARVLLT